LSFSGAREKKVFVVNLGGGVVGDLGGFVAATYNRGINYVQIPTTLLAFVDCGIGGKVGINFNGAKNIIGAFHQPSLVFADLSFLETLSKRELRSGLAEVVKYGVIQSPKLFEFVEKNVDKIFSLDKAVIQEIAVESYSIKADIVARDEFDRKGIRARLNFGHTIGHAVESASRYAYRHGESVSIGMVCANDIAVMRGLLSNGDAARVENLLVKIGLPVRMKNHNLSEILEFFWRDKKFVNGKNKFVLASQIGKTRIVDDVPMRVVERAIRNRFALPR
jgi:3-dehydroquinate synthase